MQLLCKFFLNFAFIDLVQLEQRIDDGDVAGTSEN
jgi:hypothetical protein